MFYLKNFRYENGGGFMAKKMLDGKISIFIENYLKYCNILILDKNMKKWK